MEQGTLTTQRLVLRPLTQADGKDVQRLAGERLVSDTMLTIPYPYPDGCAEPWIATHPAQWEAGKEAHFAITLRGSGQLVGVIGLTVAKSHRRADMGYWLGSEHWGKGYCTEAARAVVGFAFDGPLHLNRVTASHMVRNPASGRVMQKIGMTYEGCLRRHVCKDGQFEDIACYGILRDDFVSAQV